MLKAVRIWFQKKGSARYISHLDLNRCISRAIHKAKIPLWYTQGFNPHAFLTFALPLSLGIQGDRESFDIRLEEDVPEKELLQRLNSGLPEDIHLFAATEPIMKPGRIAFASYRIELEPERENAEAFCGKIRELFSQEEISVSKRTKSGVRDINLKSFLSRTEVQIKGNKVLIFSILPAGSVENINPSLLTQAIEKYISPNFYVFFTRTNIYTEDMKEFA